MVVKAVAVGPVGGELLPMSLDPVVQTGAGKSSRSMSGGRHRPGWVMSPATVVGAALA